MFITPSALLTVFCIALRPTQLRPWHSFVKEIIRNYSIQTCRDKTLRVPKTRESTNCNIKQIVTWKQTIHISSVDCIRENIHPSIILAGIKFVSWAKCQCNLGYSLGWIPLPQALEYVSRHVRKTSRCEYVMLEHTLSGMVAKY